MNLRKLSGRRISDSAKQDLIDLAGYYAELAKKRQLTQDEKRRLKEIAEDLEEFRYIGWGVGTYISMCNEILANQVSDSRRVSDATSKGISDEVAAYFDFLEELANEWDYVLEISDNGENKWSLEFSKYTSAGQDFSAVIIVDKKNSADYLNDEVLRKLSDYTNYFDAHEQADLWSDVVDYDEDGNEIREGKNGAPINYEDIVADMEEAKSDLNDFYIDLKRESERFIENNATDWILNKLDKVSGEFYTISKNELNTSYEDEYEPFDTLRGAVTNAMEGLSEGKRWIVVDENGVVMFDCNDSTSRERLAMSGGYEEWSDIILNFLTHEAESLI